MIKFIFLITLVCIHLFAGEIILVKSSACKVESLSTTDVKQLFMLKRTTVSGEMFLIVDSLNKDTYKKFVRNYLGKNQRQIKAYWTRMLFTGRKIPPKKLEISEFDVSRGNQCVISYCKIEEKPRNVKEILIR